MLFPTPTVRGKKRSPSHGHENEFVGINYLLLMHNQTQPYVINEFFFPTHFERLAVFKGLYPVRGANCVILNGVPVSEIP